MSATAWFWIAAIVSGLAAISIALVLRRRAGGTAQPSSAWSSLGTVASILGVASLAFFGAGGVSKLDKSATCTNDCKHPIRSLRIEEPPQAVLVNSVFRLKVAGRTRRNELVSNDALNQVRWLSTDRAVLRIDVKGVATARSPGSATVTATIDGIESPAIEIGVFPVPDLTTTTTTTTQPRRSVTPTPATAPTTTTPVPAPVLVTLKAPRTTYAKGVFDWSCVPKDWGAYCSGGNRSGDVYSVDLEGVMSDGTAASASQIQSSIRWQSDNEFVFPQQNGSVCQISIDPPPADNPYNVAQIFGYVGDRLVIEIKSTLE